MARQHLHQSVPLDPQVAEQLDDAKRLPAQLRSDGAIHRQAAEQFPRYFDAQGLTVYLGKSRDVIKTWVRLGMPAMRVGPRKFLFDRLRVDAWLEAKQIEVVCSHRPKSRAVA